MEELIDLHCHTVSSGHAYSTVKENIDSAIEKGLKYLGVSDHAPMMPGTAHIYHFNNLKVIPKEVSGVRVLLGAEVNILDYEGKVDMTEEELKALDYAIVSLHPPCIPFGNKDENTSAILNGIKHTNVKIIGHLDDSRYPVDYEKVVKAAKEKGVLLEVNNSSLKPDGFREGARENAKVLLEECRKIGAKVIFGSDSHICYDIGRFDYCRELVKAINFPKELIVNYNEEDIKEIFNI